MDFTNFYKFTQLIIIIMFTIFVSDFRKIKKSILLLSKPLLLGMRIIYVIPILLYIYIVVTLEQILSWDTIALILTFIGLIIVIIAKLSLGESHSWTGFGSVPEQFQYKGIYSMIRHPMYIGIFLCIFGMQLTIISHSARWLWLISMLSCFYIIFILLLSSQKETLHLTKIFGEPYINYVKRTPAFFPNIKKKHSI